jgi:hypothetical protein
LGTSGCAKGAAEEGGVFTHANAFSNEDGTTGTVRDLLNHKVRGELLGTRGDVGEVEDELDIAPAATDLEASSTRTNLASKR